MVIVWALPTILVLVEVVGSSPIVSRILLITFDVLYKWYFHIQTMLMWDNYGKNIYVQGGKSQRVKEYVHE